MGYDTASKRNRDIQIDAEVFTLEYWVAMDREELQVSLLLLHKTELPGVLQVDAGFTPDKTCLDRMQAKGFFERQADGSNRWSPFVKMVLWTAANPESVLSIQGRGVQSRLYFRGDTMILETKDPDSDLFLFYYVPLIPKAVGGLASSLKQLEQSMGSSAAGKCKTVSIPAGTAPDTSLKEILHSNSAVVSIDGWRFGEQALEQVLLEDADGFWLAKRDGDTISLESVGFYDFIQSQTVWIAETHGKSIARKEETGNV